MPSYTYTVKKGATTLQNIQEISWSSGRTLITDQLASGRYRIQGRRPDLLPSIAIGDIIQVTYAVGQAITFKVSDFQVTYGFTSSGDLWEILGEDAFAALGRASSTVAIGGTTGASLLGLESPTGVDFQPVIGSGLGGSSVFTQTATGNILGTATKLFNSEQPSYLTSAANTITWLDRANGSLITPNQYYATDQTPGASEWKYDTLLFGGLADNYATKVTATSAGVGSAVSGSGNRAYSLETYNSSLTDLANIAGLYAGFLSGSTVAPNQISLIAENQTSALNIIVPQQWSLSKADLFNIVFRGTTYYAMILGSTVTATPDRTRVTYNLAPSTVLASFILNSTSRGVLNQNRLGWI